MIRRSPAVHRLACILAILPLLPSISGCGANNDEGIEVAVLSDATGTGIGDGGSYPDSFLAPTEFKVGFKSVQLIKANETEPSYTVFDTEDPAQPLLMDLADGVQTRVINPVFPTDCPCEFAKIRIEVTTFEIQIPTYESETEINRRLRFYTQDLTDPGLVVPVIAGDVLIAGASTGSDFNWIDADDGLFIPLTAGRPVVPLQVPASRFPNDAYGSTVTIDLDSFLEIPDKPEGTITVTLTVHAGNIFFYDETDTTAPAYTRFDRFTDGRLNANEPDSHFYPAFPSITAATE